MTPMIKLMTILRRKHPNATQTALAEMTGIHVSTICKSFSGDTNSGILAEWMAHRWPIYGAECRKLRDDVLKQMRKNRSGDGYSRSAMCAKNRTESHRVMPHIDSDWRGWESTSMLPVVHPQPVYLGKPSYA